MSAQTRVRYFSLSEISKQNKENETRISFFVFLLLPSRPSGADMRLIRIGMSSEYF